MEKKQLRKFYKEQRKALTIVQIEEFQQSIYEQVFALSFDEIQNVHIFLPIEQQNEINTYPIIDFLSSIHKNIIVSVSDFNTAKLTHYLLEKTTQLAKNKYGIPEPINAKQVAVTAIDLVFVPLLISDEENYRVGYGKGFYDRFLSECRTDVKTIGLNFFPPISKITDRNEFDIPLGKVIYPK